MKVEIFDVEHGQCSVITSPSGKRLMIDCGSNTTTGWKPSDHFKGQQIELLHITNYDADHTSDFNGVLDKCHVRYAQGNPSINSAALEQMKAEYGMSSGIKGVHAFLKRTEQPSSGSGGYADLGDVKTTTFWNQYPYFTDANNLSDAMFVECYGFCILFPGDLETQGWNELLKKPAFREKLPSVDILVAAHHGRANGLSEEAFKYMSPAAAIISDSGLEHSTQETQSRYRARVRGCITNNGERHVITTRSDGKIEINAQPAGYTVNLCGKETRALSSGLFRF